jgi:hypothetical protein
MATRSVIGMRTEDGRIRAVYCHWDGYIEGVGAILHTFYKDANKITALLNRGGFSSLEPAIDDIEFYASKEGNLGNEAVTFSTASDMIENWYGCEYFYVFENGQWTVSTGDVFDSLYNQLKETENG